MDKSVEAKLAPTGVSAWGGRALPKAHERPWLAYVNGQMLKTRTGVGRRFKTEQAALAAAREA